MKCGVHIQHSAYTRYEGGGFGVMEMGWRSINARATDLKCGVKIRCSEYTSYESGGSGVKKMEWSSMKTSATDLQMCRDQKMNMKKNPIYQI